MDQRSLPLHSVARIVNLAMFRILHNLLQRLRKRNFLIVVLALFRLDVAFLITGVGHRAGARFILVLWVHVDMSYMLIS